MPAVTVVADDLTGANATGAGYARRGLRTVTVPAGGEAARFADRCDVLVLDTASRHLPADEAAARVREAVAAGTGAAQFVKRVDTTLRGNVGAETAALLDAVADEQGEAVRGLVVPAFPASDRVTVGGIQLVGGVPLAESDAARDALSPVTLSRVAAIIRAQADLPVTEIHLDVVVGELGPGALEEALASVEGAAVVDATADRHLRAIAAAAARVAQQGGPRWASIDSGPFGAELATALGVWQAVAANALLAVVGSITPLTRRQVGELSSGMGARVVEVDPTRGDLREGVDAEVLARLLAALGEAEVTVLRPRTHDGEPASLRGDDARRVPEMLGALAREVLERGSANGLYITGGDTTAGVLAAIGARGLAVEEEVLPLAVAGRVLGGPHDGLPVVTKGGLIGSPTAAITCLEHLRMRAAAQPPAVHGRAAGRSARADHQRRQTP